jgi:hypothetical protein
MCWGLSSLKKYSMLISRCAVWQDFSVKYIKFLPVGTTITFIRLKASMICYLYISTFLVITWYEISISNQKQTVLFMPFIITILNTNCLYKGILALGVPGRLRPQIFSTFGTTRVVGCQPNAPAAFTPGEIPGTHFQRLSQPQDTWFCRKEPWKKSQVTPPGKLFI